MDETVINLLLANLKHADESVREQATQELWHLWFYQKGISGFQRIKHSQILLEADKILQAEAVLTELIGEHPDFAEAWNRRAVLYYSQKYYQKSLHDCQQVLNLNPVHFGALHGLGLCCVALGNYRAAMRAFRQALEVQPYTLVNQKLILECTALLS
ncbi:MAG TPA: tetratricopeptide repeat protein [Candidatus Caenarcaniphilales bacterium]